MQLAGKRKRFMRVGMVLVACKHDRGTVCSRVHYETIVARMFGLYAPVMRMAHGVKIPTNDRWDDAMVMAPIGSAVYRPYKVLIPSA